MKRLLKGILLIVMVATLTVMPTQYVNATADDFNWVQWYEGNGISCVMGLIECGDMTLEEACYTILIPANDAGKVTENQKNIFLEYYPEAKAILEAHGVITGTTPTVTPAPAPEPTPVVPAYTIEDCDMYKYATTDVNVRTEPDTNAGRVGSVEQNGYAHITGITSNSWYRIEYNGISGFSVAKYYADKPVEVIENVTDTPEPTPAPTAEPTPKPTEEPVATEEPTDTEEPTATEEPVVEPTVEPTATPESTTRTEITQQVTPAPVVEPTATPVPTVAPVEDKVSTVAWVGIGVIVVVAVSAIVVMVAKGKKKE